MSDAQISDEHSETMDKESVLQSVTALVRDGELQWEELKAAFEGGETSQKERENGETSHLSSSNLDAVLYGIGALIITSAIVVLLQQQWEALGPVMRVVVTLGSSLLTFGLGFWLRTRFQMTRIAAALTGIHLLLFPVGIYVLLNSLGLSVSALHTQFFIWTVLTIGMGSIAYLLQSSLHRIATIVFGSVWYLFLVLELVNLFGFYGQLRTDVVTLLLLLMTGVWIEMGALFKGWMHRHVSPVLFTLGSLLGLGLLFSFGGWEEGFRLWFDGVIPLAIGGMVVLSEYLDSQPMLFAASFYLMLYIAKLTALYFSSAVGWPIALLIAGCAVIGVGYASVQLRSRMFS